MLYNSYYDRLAAVAYALRWAYDRNPRYYDFEDIGGDCTNFVSQCLFSGCRTMNYSQNNGWYYITQDDRSPSWTGVAFLREFLLTNKGTGVYGAETDLSELSAGDVILLENSNGTPYHAVIVSSVMFPPVPENIRICSHSFDRRNEPLTVYDHRYAQGIKILGARREF